MLDTPVGYVAYGVYNGTRTKNIVARTQQAILDRAHKSYPPTITPIYTEENYTAILKGCQKQDGYRKEYKTRNFLGTLNSADQEQGKPPVPLNRIPDNQKD